MNYVPIHECKHSMDVRMYDAHRHYYIDTLQYNLILRVCVMIHRIAQRHHVVEEEINLRNNEAYSHHQQLATSAGAASIPDYETV